MGGIGAVRRRELEEAVKVSEGSLLAAVAELPSDIRKRLAIGPAASRYACSVCDAFRCCDLAEGLPYDDPRWVVFNFHEVPKLRMRTANDQWFGPLAIEVYDRCRMIYRAAGWLPSASTGRPGTQ